MMNGSATREGGSTEPHTLSNRVVRAALSVCEACNQCVDETPRFTHLVRVLTPRIIEQLRAPRLSRPAVGEISRLSPKEREYERLESVSMRIGHAAGGSIGRQGYVGWQSHGTNVMHQACQR
jgi:hypothetical protein